ncbi:MAG: hypothetical protein V7L23_26795 [Nostoc sp.]|uniref:hypothetical protein n=1 Tax=Nostoc sp. TaxID=1180 RepID=UPI002FF2DE7D
MKNLTIEQIYLAIRNRGYTNQVRLRGLKKLETHGGGFCLYSRELYSPRYIFTNHDDFDVFLISD